MGFGPVLRQWVSTLHRDTSACFMLHSLSPDLATIFSLRQGDPFAGILFTIHMEPFLVKLEELLRGLFVAHFREASLGYMEDVAGLGDTEAVPVVADNVRRDIEAVSGAN